MGWRCNILMVSGVVLPTSRGIYRKDRSNLITVVLGQLWANETIICAD